MTTEGKAFSAETSAFADALMTAVAAQEPPPRELVASFWAFIYGGVAERYDRYDSAAPCHLLERLALRPGDRVLDVGTGTGSMARLVAAAVGPTGEVTGVDVSDRMLALAASHPQAGASAPIAYEVADVCDLSRFRSAHFDAVTASLALFFVGDLQLALRECLRVLRPGGTLAFTTITEAMPAREIVDQLLRLLPAKTVDGMRLFDDAWACAQLGQAGFVEISSKEVVLPTPEGIGFPQTLLDFLESIGMGMPPGASGADEWAGSQAIRSYCATRPMP